MEPIMVLAGVSDFTLKHSMETGIKFHYPTKWVWTKKQSHKTHHFSLDKTEKRILKQLVSA